MAPSRFRSLLLSIPRMDSEEPRSAWHLGHFQDNFRIKQRLIHTGVLNDQTEQLAKN